MSGSVWLSPSREPRARAGQTLSRDHVARAAVELAEADGLAAVTMRSVAKALGITAMSLYWYVDSKDQIIELMIDRVFREQKAPRGTEWRPVLRSLARNNRRLFESHPWLVSVRERADKIPSPAQMDHYERVVRALLRVQPDLGAAAVTTVISVMNHLAAGHAATSFPGALAEVADDIPARDYLSAIVLDGKHASLAVYAGQFAAFTKDRFADEVEVVLDGLARYFE